MIKKPKAKAPAKPKAKALAAKKLSSRSSSGGATLMRHAATGTFRGSAAEHRSETRRPVSPAGRVSPVGAALRTFQKVATKLGLGTDAKLTLLGMKHTKFFNSLKDADPNLGQDTEDRLGYFLVIVDLAAGLVGDPGAWLHSPNQAPLFGGKPPIDLLLAGRMEGMFSTLNYLRSAQGGWA